jgi:hypothetical protein
MAAWMIGFSMPSLSVMRVRMGMRGSFDQLER